MSIVERSAFCFSMLILLGYCVEYDLDITVCTKSHIASMLLFLAGFEEFWTLSWTLILIPKLHDFGGFSG